MMNRSIDREDYAENQDVVRAHARMNSWSIEEDREDRSNVRFRQVSRQDMRGKFNKSFVNSIGVRTGPSGIEMILENYRQIHGTQRKEGLLREEQESRMQIFS